MSDLDVAFAFPLVCLAIVLVIVAYALVVEHGDELLRWARERLERERDPDRELLQVMDAATPLWAELDRLAPWPHEASTSTADPVAGSAVRNVADRLGGEKGDSR